MKNILTDISLEKTVQSSLQLDAEKKARKKHTRHTIESVRASVESFGYKLISTQYVSVMKKLDISCPLGHRYSVSYSSFQVGARCLECAGLKKHTIDAVKQYIESFKGYRLLSTTYKNNSTKLDILCPKEHLYKVTYACFQSGRRCPECAGNAKHRLSNVKRHIESFGYRLRSTTYKDIETKLDIVCPVGHNYKANYGNFQKGQRCAECDDISKRRTMPDGEEWEPRCRQTKADRAWARAVKKRDGQICQICFSPSKKLHAHHIESYARNPELRTKLSNGITLCVNCHYALHSRYGQTTATRADLEEFTRLKYF